MRTIDRRAFLRDAAVAAGSLTMAGPLQALAARVALADEVDAVGFGPLAPVGAGDLKLPSGFSYEIVSRTGAVMSDGLTTPTRFDGMATFKGDDDTTVILRNHENRRRLPLVAAGEIQANEIDAMLPDALRYDDTMVTVDGVSRPLASGGVSRLIIDKEGEVIDSSLLLAGTTHNCAGGTTPWESWITCEELYQNNTLATPMVPHGYIFEVDAFASGPVVAVPIRTAGRFEHEAVAWLDGVLYETEDRANASFYRYEPSSEPRVAGDLASSGGMLQALRVIGAPLFDTRPGGAWGVGTTREVDWVTIADPDPQGSNDGSGTSAPATSVRGQARAQGAATFARTEGCWVAGSKVFFDCTTGGGTIGAGGAFAPGAGQIWMLEPDGDEGSLTLLFESLDRALLLGPDNLTVGPKDVVYLCEDAGGGATDPVPHIRGLTEEGGLFDLAEAVTNKSEFCGACFDERNEVLYVNQQGNPQQNPAPLGVTYAIRGPWDDVKD